MSGDRCGESIWDGWRSRVCGRTVKRDGMCGIHAAAKERREKNDAARREASQRRTQRAEEAAARQQELLDAEAAVKRVEALADEWAQIGGDNTTAVEQWHAAAEWLLLTLRPTAPAHSQPETGADAGEGGGGRG